ncbi:MAG: penicillin acylase family protein, partial [Bacteroidota bacterium]
MSSIIKIIIGIFLTLLVILIAFGIISYSVLDSKIPEYSGEHYVSGITQEVQIFRDNFAVPYIIAENELDVVFALGYVHAQERLFQMDMARRAGEGRLSEIIGSKTVPFDKMFRTLGLFKTVQKSYDKLNPISKQYLEAYSKGVNEYIKNADGNFTFEFDILGYDPYPWKPEHSLVIAKLLAWELNISWWTDIVFSHLVQKLGEEKVAEIIPDYDENSPTIIPEKLNSYSEIPLNLYKVDRKFREFSGFVGTHIGSNNWVVNGNKSDSGSVIIANDPHLAHRLPGHFLFAVVRSNEWNGEGFSIPGLPFFIIGKNQNISWVLTNVMADDSDFYIEKLDSTNTHYLLDDEWRELNIASDTIIVKDSSSVIYDIVKTHRGPIISEIHLYDILYSNEYQNKTTMSMRWTALDYTDDLYAMISVNKAKNWSDFRKALKHFTAPGQNFVYGDIKGNIGYVCAAKLPLRNNNSPTMVYDGSNSENDWKGFVPYSKMPKLYNPNENFIASANNKTVNDFPYHISNIWEPASRIDRITELLKSKETHSAEDFK